ncbi:MAG: SUMF1/EgtB/PvdO family nonheme iron enzyme [Phycisphaerae bacterium]|nr:SUMF1/EgtB/PvdO family nonheme iron enzyme [Phycisphaerae bacterium]
MARIRVNTGASLTPANFRCDVNGDGRINTLDMAIIRNNIGETGAICPPPPGVLSVAESEDFICTGDQGGPFAPSSKTYLLTNTGGLPIVWTAAKTQAWITLSKTGGTLGGRGSDSIEVWLNAGASDLPVGTHSDTLSLINATNHSGDTTRAVNLSVNRRPIPPGMVFIPGGEFQMGDTFNEGVATERPVHGIHVDAFFMDCCPVTNRQFAEALNWAQGQGNLITVTSGSVYRSGVGTINLYCDTVTSSSYSGITWDGLRFGVVAGKDNHPMVMVSWHGSAAYANWRSGMQSRPLCYDPSTGECNSSDGYRLPTEAEWERAARGGAAGRRFPWSDSDEIQHARANYWSSANYVYDTSPTRGYHPAFGSGTSPVGYFAANGYGLHDMAGNVWEWCNDWYAGDYYSGSPKDNPRGPTGGAERVLRGGGWLNHAYYSRAASRYYNHPGSRGPGYGFRLILNAE